jgi:hypothetical protein
MYSVTYNFNLNNESEQNPQQDYTIDSHAKLPPSLKNPLKIIPFLQDYNFQENTFITFLLDDSYHIIAFDISDQAKVDINDMIKFCITYNAKHIVLATKTVDALHQPRLNDLPYHLINNLHTKLNTFSISLLDYIFFSQDDFFSLRYHDLLATPQYPASTSEN